MTARSFVVLVLACLGAAPPAAARAQESEANRELRGRIERQFEIVLLRDGVLLTPRSSRPGVRSVEVAGSGEIAIDGTPVTGAELRERLGPDADLVLQLTYLDADARRALFAPPAPAPPAPPEPPAAPAAPDRPGVEPRSAPNLPERPSSSTRRTRDRVRIGGSVVVDADEVVEGDVVAVGGSATVRGEVHGNVVAVGGGVTLGPRAFVRRDVTVVGGTLRQDDSARIGGEVHEISIGAFPVGNMNWPAIPGTWRWTFGSAFALMTTVVRVAVLCLLAALVVLLARDQVDRVGLRAAAEPLKSGGIGFLAQLLFLPLLIVTIIVLVITIIGIPLLVLIPFALLALGMVALVGFTAVAQVSGRFISQKLGWDIHGPYAITVFGILVLLAPLLLARLIGLAGGPVFPMTFGLGVIGVIVEYAAWTVGFGAVALARFNRPRPPDVVMGGPTPASA